MSNIDDLIASGKWVLQKRELASWGIVPVINSLGPDIVGLEIGIHTGLNSFMLLENCMNINLLYGIDPFISYHDWRELIDQNTQNHVKNVFLENKINLGSKYEWVHAKSSDVVNQFTDNSLDFIFIDGDHSEDGVFSDLVNYVPKVKPGGIVAGHDLWYEGVQNALSKYHEQYDSTIASKFNQVVNTAWYWIK